MAKRPKRKARSYEHFPGFIQESLLRLHVSNDPAEINEATGELAKIPKFESIKLHLADIIDPEIEHPPSPESRAAVFRLLYDKLPNPHALSVLGEHAERHMEKVKVSVNEGSLRPHIDEVENNASDPHKAYLAGALALPTVRGIAATHVASDTARRSIRSAATTRDNFVKFLERGALAADKKGDAKRAAFLIDRAAELSKLNLNTN